MLRITNAVIRYSYPKDTTYTYNELIRYGNVCLLPIRNIDRPTNQVEK